MLSCLGEGEQHERANKRVRERTCVIGRHDLEFGTACEAHALTPPQRPRSLSRLLIHSLGMARSLPVSFCLSLCVRACLCVRKV